MVEVQAFDIHATLRAMLDLRVRDDQTPAAKAERAALEAAWATNMPSDPDPSAMLLTLAVCRIQRLECDAASPMPEGAETGA